MKKRQWNKHLGAKSELLACAWLLGQGYEVYRNVSSYGVIDIIAIKDGNIERFDVKSGNIINDRLVIARLSKKQVSDGIKLLVVLPDGEVSISLRNDSGPIKRNDSGKIEEFDRTIVAVCKGCGNNFSFLETKYNLKNRKFCTNDCRHTWYKMQQIKVKDKLVKIS